MVHVLRSCQIEKLGRKEGRKGVLKGVIPVYVYRVTDSESGPLTFTYLFFLSLLTR